MSNNRKRNKAVRARMAEKGTSYTRALREIEAEIKLTRELEMEALMPDVIEAEQQSAEELLIGSIQGCLDGLVGADFVIPSDSSGWDGVGLPPGISELVTASFDADLDSVVVHPAETYEDGTMAANVSSRASLVLEGLMGKADANAAAAAGLVAVTDEDFNAHYASVLVESPIEVEVEFEAIVMEAYQSVEDFRYVGAAPVTDRRTPV